MSTWNNAYPEKKDSKIEAYFKSNFEFFTIKGHLPE